MKKIIFLLLLAQTISFLYGDAGCQDYNWRWGRRAIQHTKCYCNCSKYGRDANGKCINCQHKNIPVDMKINSKASASNSAPAQ